MYNLFIKQKKPFSNFIKVLCSLVRGVFLPMLSPKMLVIGVALVAFSTTSVFEVYAQSINRKETKIGVKRLERKKKISDEPTTLSGPRISKAAILASTVEVRLIKGINNTLQQMRKILRSQPPKSPEKLRIMKRMLQLQLDQAVHITSKEHEQYEQQWTIWNSNGQKGAEPQLVHTKSNRMWLKFTNLSSAIIREYPNNKTLDAVMKNQGLGLEFLNKEDEAAKVYSSLIKNYPNSSYAGDAYHSLGDYYFQKNQYDNAIRNYKMVIDKHRNSQRYPWSLFKLGWSYYNKENHRKALSMWKRTVIHAKKGNAYSQTLRKEALRDMVYAFAEIGDVNSAISYFRSNGGDDYVSRFLSLLASTLVDQGKFENAVSAYKKLQSLTPRAEEAPQAQSSLIALVFELGNYNRLWSELRLYARLYGKNSPWSKSQSDKRLVLETQVNVRNEILYYSKLTHSNAQKTKSIQLMDQAEKGYILYLTQYPKSRQSVEVKFNLADLLYFRKNYTKAGRLYLEITMLGKDKAIVVDENGKRIKNIHHDSASFMLDSFYKAYEPELKKILILKNPIDLSKPKKQLSLKAGNFVKACGTYLSFYQRDKKIEKNCNVFIAETYYRLNDRELALKHLWIVARKYPGTKQGQKAVTSILPLYKNDINGLNLALIEFRKIPAYNQGPIAKKLRDLHRGVHEEFVAKEKKHIEKAKGFLKLASTYPDYNEAYKYYYNASLAFIAGGDLVSALEADKVIVSKYPKVPEAEQSLLRMAEMSENLVEYNNALRYYFLYSKRYPNSKKLVGALQKACDLGLVIYSDPQKVLKSCGPLKTKSIGGYVYAFEGIIQSLYARQDYDQLKQFTSIYLNTQGVDTAKKIKVLFLVYASTKKSNGVNAAAAYGNNIIKLFSSNKAQVSKDPKALENVANVYFDKVKPVAEQFASKQLRGGTLAVMSKSLEIINSSLVNLQAQFTQVVALGNANWGVAAQFEIGKAYLSYASQLKDPPGIKGASLADVKKQLLPQANQAQAKALEYFRAAQSSMEKFNVYSPYSLKVAGAISKIKGGKTTTDDWVMLPDFLGSPTTEELSSVLH